MTEAAALEATPSHSSLDAAAASVLAPSRSAIDASVRPVVVGLFLTATVWLLVSTLLGALAAVKLHHPDFLNFSFLTYGRLAPAAENTFVFGWCGAAALGVGAWIIARTSGRVSPGHTLAAFGAVLWNGGVLVGLVATLGGWMRPLNGLESPIASYLLLFAGLALFSIWVLLTFHDDEHHSLAAMFILAAFVWLGLSLLTGNLLIATNSVTGVVQQIVAAWTAGAVSRLFLVPLALGAAFYVVPKVSGAPIIAGSFARVMFWMYFGCAGLSLAAKVPGDLLPLWLGATAASASILIVVPVVALVYILLASAGVSHHGAGSPSLRFTVFGCGGLILSSLLIALASLRSVDSVVRFTLFDAGIHSLLIHVSVTMVLFGAIYYMMPRLSECEWLSSSLISFHFLGAAYGSSMAVGMLLLSGLAAGEAISEGASSFQQVMEVGSSYFWGNSISYVFVMAAHAAFGLHFLLMALKIGQPAGEPTLLRAGSEH
jgi:cytochrome c oxidase cbb3-type subunit 1